VGRSDSHAGCARPDPPAGGGVGKPGFPMPLRGGGVGKPGFPTPLLQQPMFTLAVHAAAPHNAAMNIRLFLGGRSPPRPSRGWGHGETRFPHAPAGRGRGETRFPHTPCARAASSLSRGRGYGGTWFPHVHLSRPCGSAAHRRNEHRLRARAARPRRVSAGTVTAPLPSPPPAGGRESGSSPQRGEVRRGVQRRMRVGEQPMFTLGCPREPWRAKPGADPGRDRAAPGAV